MRECAVAGAKVDGAGEVAQYGFQAFDQVGRGASLEETGLGEPGCGAVQATTVQGAIEQGGRDWHEPYQ